MSEILGFREPPREGLRDRVLALRSQPLFEGLDDEALLLLAEHARSVTYRAGDVVAPEDEPPRALFIVLEGELVATRQGKALVKIGPGSAYGAFALLAREPPPLASAATTMRVLEGPAAALETALDENHSLLRKGLAVAAAGVLEFTGNLPASPLFPPEVDEGTYYPEPKSMVERLIQVRRGNFARMNLEALIDLARQMIEVRFPAGHLLWSAGDPPTHSLYIDCGRVRCIAPDGEHVDIGSNFTLGVLDVWGAKQRAYTARTETPVIGYRIEFETFLTLLESHVEVGIQLLRTFARTLVVERYASQSGRN